MKRLLLIAVFSILGFTAFGQAKLGVADSSLAIDTTVAIDSARISYALLNRGNATIYFDTIVTAMSVDGKVFPNVHTTVLSDSLGPGRVYAIAFKVNTSSYFHPGLNIVVVWPTSSRYNTVDSSGEYNLLLPDPVGINENGKPASHVRFYPNPAQDVLYFEYTGEGQKVKELYITDIQGRRLMKADPQQGYINVSGLAAGTYLINVKCKNGILESAQMIKTR